MPNNNERLSGSNLGAIFQEDTNFVREIDNLISQTPSPNLVGGVQFYENPMLYRPTQPPPVGESISDVVVKLTEELAALQKTVEEQNNTIEYLKEIFEQMIVIQERL